MFWWEDTVLMPLTSNSNLKSQSLVWRHQTQLAVKLLNKNKSGWDVQQPQLSGKWILSSHRDWKYKAQSEWRQKSMYKQCLKIECFPKLLMRCRCKSYSKLRPYKSRWSCTWLCWSTYLQQCATDIHNLHPQEFLMPYHVLS